MNKKKVVFVVFTIILGALTMLSFIPNESVGFELRLQEYILLYDGPIQCVLISITSFYLFVIFVISKKKDLIIAFSIVTIIFLGLSYLSLQLGFGPQVKEDRIVYHNESDDSERLIFQYYEVGVTGNTRWKAITTNNILGDIRWIKNEDVEYLRELVEIGDRTIKLENLPKKLELDNKIFELEKVVMFYTDSIINY